MDENMKKIIKEAERGFILWQLFQNSTLKITIIALTFSFLFSMTLTARPAKKDKKLFKELAGLHGRVTSITRFFPFELYDVSQNNFRDLSFDYLEMTTLSGKKRKMIYLGTSEFILEDEACLLFKPLNYGSLLLKDIFEKDDPARDILPLSHIRVAADGVVTNPSFSHCLLCSDEEEKIFVVYLEKGRGGCERWKNEEGTSYLRIEADEDNYSEANSKKGCLETGGSGGCMAVGYREY
jgi:hypothetical protein